ncbi:6-carboxytetrahydropterin synthase [Ferrovum sp.]|uniref:6-carboxytetrahydropterin synthase n=1 Tax=Ferrovum sp. TaxID=2609467 RepID=UPI0026021BE9|nr:6-carboxytetrahydropterin synthase [Ferrovum sp.]
MKAGAYHDWQARGFEASRQVIGAMDPRLQRRHGHSFRVEVCDPLRGESSSGQLGDLLSNVVEQLDYQDLDVLFSQRHDAEIWHWIEDRLDLAPGSHGYLASGPWRGVVRDTMGRLHGWMRDRFESAHFLPNVPAGHKCGRLHGHGFEVVLFFPWEGQAAQLKTRWEGLHARLHGRCLNELSGLDIPTSEILAGWIWSRLQAQGQALTQVAVYETASSGSSFDGTRYRIWKEQSFDSALRSPEGALWGHTYRLRLGLSAPLDEMMGWTQDFGEVKRLFDPLYRELDHQPLHDKIPAGTTLALLDWVLARTRSLLPTLDRLDLYDTPGSGKIWTLPMTGPVR